ncbi:MAG: thioredoxin-disulfide reductase [Candidatus Aminicenantes bacterium]|nr:thioredoxin-disulfide reductase [Candidatus Aminicenantes bacterium]
MKGSYDVIIIGAGPAGLAAAIYTGRARLKTLILEKAIPGGQIMLTDWIENYPGFPEGIAPFELMDNFRKQALRFGAEIENDEVQSLERKGKEWLVHGRRDDYLAKAIIIATGSTYRRLGLEKEVRLIGRGVSYCATCDGAFFRDKVVAVIGGGDNALTEALFLTKFCRQVYIIHRRQTFRAVRILQERVAANEKIVVLWNSVVEEILGENKVEALKIKNVLNKEEKILPVDGVFISIGMEPQSAFLRGVVEMNEWGQIKVNRNLATNQPGLFAAGDVIEDCPRQVATAVGTGVAAAIAVDKYLSSLETN